MSRVWNATFEAEPAGGNAGSVLDDKIRELKSEIQKRMDTLVSNWADDPDTPTSLDIADDAVLAEHISGLTGTGAVDTDNIPEGSTNKYLNGAGTLDDLADGTTYLKPAGINASHKITKDSFNATGTYHSYNLAGGESWTIPAGVYMMAAMSTFLHLQVGTSGGVGGETPPGGLIVSDGVGYKIYNSDSNYHYIEYNKLD